MLQRTDVRPGEIRCERGMKTEHAHVQDWLPLTPAEFDELPALQLTRHQVEELWGLDATVAEAILRELVSTGFLKQTSPGGYVRGDAP